jgi:hypothetical protein
VRPGIVPELDDEWVAVESALHRCALDAPAAAVNESNLTKACRVRGVKILLNNVDHVTRRERVQIQRVFDRNFVHRA